MANDKDLNTTYNNSLYASLFPNWILFKEKNISKSLYQLYSNAVMLAMSISLQVLQQIQKGHIYVLILWSEY